MIVNAIYEFYADLRKSLRWWKILIFILASLILISLNVAYEETKGFNVMKIYITVWIYNTIRPKVSKLNYLLPGDKSSRSYYLIGAGSGSILFFAIWFGVIYSVGVLMGTYSVENVLRIFFCEDLLLIIISSFTIMVQVITTRLLLILRMIKVQEIRLRLQKPIFLIRSL